MNSAAPKSLFWRRFKKNKAALAGVAVVIISFLLFVFAYAIAPDNTPYANTIIPEIGSKKPGYSIQLLRVKKEREVEQAGFFSKLIYGKESPYQYIPFVRSSKTGNTIMIWKFIDEGIAEQQFYSTDRLAADPVIRRHYLLGTDKFGRDILSRLIVGIRVSLSVGFIAVFISLTIGILLGAIAGYFKGWADDVIMWFINVIWSIPTLLLVFAITLALGKGFWQVFIAVGLTMWVNVARLVRGQILAVREQEYVEAAKALGFNNTRIIFHHILPNILGPVMVIAASNFASAIVIEAGLSFLGVGVQPPQPSWGLMIKENYNFIITNNPMLALAPGIAIMLLVLAFNLLGNGLRDALNVKAKL
jgi:ABC-type dipeptide/oligopeptide/nickel transport system permease subunit